MIKKTITPQGPLAWMAGNSVIANLIMFVFLIGGLIMVFNIKQEVFPDFTEDTVTIAISYPGASPEEVENGIILAVEQALEDIEGIDDISSSATEGAALVTVDFMEGTDVIRVWQEIKSQVDGVTTFPNEAEDPIVSIGSHKRDVLTLALHGDVDELTLCSAADAIRDRLLLDSHITQVVLTGIKDYEVRVEIPQAALRRYGITLADVAGTISKASVELGGGSLKTRAGDVLVRVKDRREYADQYARIPLLTREDGSRILLQDVAAVKETFEDSNTWSHFNGNPSVMIEIYRTGDQTPAQVANAARAIIDNLNQTLPQGLFLTILRDSSKVFIQRAKLLTKNALQGLVLVFFFLALFLETRLAFWVSLGIPISFIGSFLFLSAADFSINIISMFAFIVTLGIVVDDAVVVGENIYHWRSRGLSPLDASIAGVREVALPVIFSVLTNLVAFMPLFFVPGYIGKLFCVIPLVVAAVFGISLIESLFILPAHLSHRTRNQAIWPLNCLERIQGRFSRAFESFVRNRFGHFLKIMISRRYGVIAFGFALMLGLGGYVSSGRMGIEMFPRNESDFAYCKATLPYGSSESELKFVEEQIVKSARAVIEKNGGQALSLGTLSYVSCNNIIARIFLTSEDTRPMSTSQLTRLWRKETGTLAGLESLRFESNSGGPGSGKNLTVRLAHTNTRTLEKAGKEMARALSGYAIVHDVDDGAKQGKRQYDIQLLPLGERMGLTSKEVAQQVRYAFQGVEAVKQQRGKNEVTVRVSLPGSERITEYTLENLVLQADNKEIYLRDAVKMKAGRAYTQINRINGQRIIEVTANVNPPAQAENILKEVKTKIMPRLKEKYPGLTMGLGGHQEEMRKSLKSLVTGSLLALFGIYALLTIPFKSYTQPLIIMISIPFGIIGAVIGHIIMGYSLSVNSIFGVVALSGVVVNDSLVLIDFANTRVKNGAPHLDAIISAGIQRFRPILLTTVTTFGGVVPLITETSFQARIMIPMAISLGFGVLFSTAIILIMVPCLFMALDDVSRLMYKSAGTAALERHG